MDNKKIGKLIADLRNKQGLTQQELGDKVGVGFRAVSKWERGLTLPDITIINELSKILGITSDELLSGKLKTENKTNNKIFSSKKPLIITIITIVAIIVLISSLLTYNNNKIYTYDMVSVEQSEYYVEGKVTFDGNDISIILNKLEFLDDEFATTIIKKYEYKIASNDTFIFGYGYSENSRNIEDTIMAEDFANNFSINYTGQIDLKRKEILDDNLRIEFKFVDNDNNEIIKEIKISLLD